MDSVFRLGFDCFGKHSLEPDFQSHGMGAALVCHEEFAVTIEHTTIKGHMVTVIITMKSNIKLVEEETIFLLGIAFCLFSFSDHSIVHV